MVQTSSSSPVSWLRRQFSPATLLSLWHSYSAHLCLVIDEKIESETNQNRKVKVKVISIQSGHSLWHSYSAHSMVMQRNSKDETYQSEKVKENVWAIRPATCSICDTHTLHTKIYQLCIQGMPLARILCYYDYLPWWSISVVHKRSLLATAHSRAVCNEAKLIQNLIIRWIN